MKATKKPHTNRFPRMLRILIPLVILGGIIFTSAQVVRTPIGPGSEVCYVRATVTEVLEDYSGGMPFQGTQKVAAQITSGQFKGSFCTLNNPNAYQNGAFCVPGTKIIAFVREGSDGTLGGSVYNYDRTGMLVLLLGLFAAALLLVGGKKGAASLYALVFTFVCILCLFIPLLYVGMNSILAAILTAVTILAASIYILNGWSIKTGCAILGTAAGIAISGILAMVMGRTASLTGYHTPDVESMVYVAVSTKLDIGNILYAGILISCLGAVMDVSVSMVAAMWEIHQKVPSITARELFASGMRVGQDMMGTMSNTLILAYTGSATAVLLTVYSYEMSFLQIMGHNSVVVEILSGLCGTIGVILTVPLQALVTTLVLKSKTAAKQLPK